MSAGVPATFTPGSDWPSPPGRVGDQGIGGAVEHQDRRGSGAAELEVDGHGGDGRDLAGVLAAVADGERGARGEAGEEHAVEVDARASARRGGGGR